MLSIIIPTLNEERLLPRLLHSIAQQSLQDYEIIVADAGSADKTLEIARQYGCKIIRGGLPPKGRNLGAEEAKGDLLLFLDADVALSGSMQKALQEFECRKLDVASCYLQTFNRTAMGKALYEIAYNFPIRVLEHVLPHGADFMLIKKISASSNGRFR